MSGSVAPASGTVVSLVRWALTTAGGALVATGVATQSQETALVSDLITVVGALIPAATIAWEIWEKASAKKVAAPIAPVAVAPVVGA